MTPGANGEPPVPDPERKGIPLNSKAPRLTPEQELLRDKALEKYKRRKARQERRQARLVAREARVANPREGSIDDGAEDLDDYDGASSVTSRTTLTSAATTVRTASTAAYGRGSYLLPPPHLCGVDVNDEDDEEGEELRSVQSHNSRRSSGTAKSKASQGTVATIKSYMRHRQRQRLRRREEQQQVELFNQWAHAQMASSSELSPSSKSSGVSSAASQEGREDTKGHHNTHHRNHRRASGTRNGGGGDRSQRHRGTFESSFNGGFEYRSAQPRQRSSSVASSAPRPPEEILGEDHVRYSFMQGNGSATAPAAATTTKVSKSVGGSDASREQAHLQAGFPATPNTFRVHPDFASRAAHDVRGGGGEMAEDNTGAAVPPTHPPTNRSMHVDPLPPPPPPRRQRRTWKAVEHSAALSGFFNSPANKSFGGHDGHYDDGEVPAPFRGTAGEPSHSPAGQPHLARE